MNPIENLDARGRGVAPGMYIAKATGYHGIGTIRVDHETNEAFWIEVHMTTAQVQELLRQMKEDA